MIVPFQIFSDVTFAYFLAGGYMPHSINETCAIEIANETATRLSTTPLFISSLDSVQCLTKLGQLETAASQVMLY